MVSYEEGTQRALLMSSHVLRGSPGIFQVPMVGQHATEEGYSKILNEMPKTCIDYSLQI